MAAEWQFEPRDQLWQDLLRVSSERVAMIRCGYVFFPYVMQKRVYGPFDMIFPYFWSMQREQ